MDNMMNKNSIGEPDEFGRARDDVLSMSGVVEKTDSGTVPFSPEEREKRRQEAEAQERLASEERARQREEADAAAAKLLAEKEAKTAQEVARLRAELDTPIDQEGKNREPIHLVLDVRRMLLPSNLENMNGDKRALRAVYLKAYDLLLLAMHKTIELFSLEDDVKLMGTDEMRADFLSKYYADLGKDEINLVRVLKQVKEGLQLDTPKLD
jgi:hypothetical protein